MIIFAAFGIFVEVWFSFLVKQRSVFYIVGKISAGTVKGKKADVSSVSPSLEQWSSLSKPSLVEVFSASSGVIVRDWDHVSYLAFFYSADLFWLQLALLVLASVIR